MSELGVNVPALIAQVVAVAILIVIITLVWFAFRALNKVIKDRNS